MQPWIIIILIVVTCLTILMYSRSAKHSVSEGFGAFYNDQMAYAGKQYIRSHDQGTKVLFAQPGAPIDKGSMKDVINSPDLYLANTPERDYSTYLITDPTFKFISMDSLCRNATMPKNLPPHIPQQTNNCGWWFVADPSTPSVGAAGTVGAPLFPEKLPGGGEWIYDLKVAQQLEEIKECMRITNCAILDAPGISGNCGFCPSKGYAVPITGNGSEKYPDVPSACGEKPLPNSAACNAPSSNTSNITSNGLTCNPSMGTSSSDSTLRLYTNDECNKLGGNWFKNGECLAQSGDSYSEACAVNNLPPSLTSNNTGADGGGAEPDICAPGKNGNISPECLISLAKGLGYSPSGSILKILYSANTPVGNDAIAISMLQKAGIAVPSAILGQGNTDVKSAIRAYQAIWKAMTTGNTEMIKQCATLLCVGLESFDVCVFNDRDRGPFPTLCIERAFRQAGCQLAGTAAPTDANVGQFASSTWGQVKQKFASLHNTMSSGNSATQDDSMTKCLGIKYYRPQPIPCDAPGMERIWYSAQYDSYWAKDCNEKKWGPVTIRYPAFMGRDTNPNGWAQINSPYSQGIGMNRHNFAYMKSRTMIDPSSLGTNQGNFDIWVDDGFRFAVNGQETYARWIGQPATHYTVPVSLTPSKKNLVEMAYNNGGGPGQLTIGGDFFDKMNIAGQMPFPETAPVIAFDFFRGTDKDRHGTVMSANFGAQLKTVNGIMSITTGPDQYIQILTPIRHKVIKTYTWYARATPSPDGQPRQPSALCLSEWPNIDAANPDTPQARGAIEYGSRLNFFMGDAQSTTYLVGQYFRNLWYAVGASGTGKGDPTAWHHYAIVMHNYGGTMYIDGEKVGDFSNPDLYADKSGSWTPYPDIIMRQIFIGRQADNRFGGDKWRDRVFDKEPGASFAFVHMYDRILTPENIKNEMKYMNDPIYNTGPDLSKPSNEVVTMNDQYFGQIIAMGWDSKSQVRG